MANISTAEGSITLKGSSKSICAFLRLMAFTETYTYCVHVPDSEDIIEQQTKFNYDNTDETIDFMGLGRWNMERTIRDIMKWLDHDRQNDQKWTTELEKAWQQLNQKPVSALFDYVDHDGSEFIVEETAELTWAPNQLGDTVVKMTEREEYTPTAENYDKHTSENVYDYSTYSVNKLKESYTCNNWINELTNGHILNPQNTPLFEQNFDKLIPVLGNELDIRRRNGSNALWADPSDWLEDEVVREVIATIMNDY